MPKVTIKPRTGKDFFNYLEMAEVNRDRANEQALLDFILIDGEELSIEQIPKMSGEALTLLKGRVFTLNTVGVKQDDEYLTFQEHKIKKLPIKYNALEELQLRIQRLQEKGSSTTVDLVKTSIKFFYEITIDELEKLPYEISAFCFSYVNNFFRRSTEAKTEFDIDDLWV